MVYARCCDACSRARDLMGCAAAGFSLYGLAKFRPMKTQPLACSVVGTVIILSVFVWTWLAYFQAKRDVAAQTEKPDAPIADANKSHDLVGVLETCAARALFFGACQDCACWA